MTLGIAWILCIVGTPVSIGFMVLLTYLENRKLWKEKRDARQ